MLTTVLLGVVGVLQLLLLIVAIRLWRLWEGSDEEDAGATLQADIATLRTQIGEAEGRRNQMLTQYFQHLLEGQHRAGGAVGEACAQLKDLSHRLEARQLESRAALEHLLDERLLAIAQRQHEAASAASRQLAQDIEKLRSGNEAALEKMRETVGEKLEATLSQRLSSSFKTVDDKLGLVERGLGEMRVMAQNVRDLQGVLTNVKTRGTFGEVQLERLLDDILAPGQFECQKRLDAKSLEAVDFAVKLPGRTEGEACWLPIDAKFPMEDYRRLVAAQEAHDRDAEAKARAALSRAVLVQAKSIREKYVRAPLTTEFAVMYLPSESLYAELLRTDDLFERLQRDYRITPAGPSVIAALLNGLQMGFVTLAIEARSAEIWRLLADVKAEFTLFCDQFEHMAKKFEETRNSVEKLRTRRNVMARTMTAIEAGESAQAKPLATLPREDEERATMARNEN